MIHRGPRTIIMSPQSTVMAREIEILPHPENPNPKRKRNDGDAGKRHNRCDDLYECLCFPIIAVTAFASCDCLKECGCCNCECDCCKCDCCGCCDCCSE